MLTVTLDTVMLPHLGAARPHCLEEGWPRHYDLGPLAGK